MDDFVCSVVLSFLNGETDLTKVNHTHIPKAVIHRKLLNIDL